MAEVHIRVRLSPSLTRWGLAAILLGAAAAELATETHSLSTYYPAPTGVYSGITSTGDTTLARNPGSQVGIGTTNPAATLDVNGAASVEGDFTAAGKASAVDVLAKTVSVLNNVSCPPGLICIKSGNTLTISPACSPSCQNGGTCTGQNTCSCPATWTGPTCSTPVCSPDCQNGGTCAAPNVCSCNGGYTGPTCGTPPAVNCGPSGTQNRLYSICNGVCVYSPSWLCPAGCTATNITWQPAGYCCSDNYCPGPRWYCRVYFKCVLQ